MSEIANLTIDFKAKITGYEAEVKKVREALNRIGEDAPIGKQLGKQLEGFQGKLAKFSRNATRTITSESQLSKIVNEAIALDQAFMKLANDMGNIKVGDLKFDEMEKSTQEAILRLQELQEQLSQNTTQAFQEAAKEATELQKTFALLKIDPSKLSVDAIGGKLTAGLKSAEEQAKKTAEALAELEKKQASLNDKLSSLKTNPFSNTEARTGDLYSSFFGNTDIEARVKEIKEKLAEAASSIKDSSTKGDTLNLIDSIIGTDAPEKIQQRINEIVAKIREGTGSLQAIRQSFSELGLRNNTNTANIVDAIFGSIDFTSAKTGFQDKLNQLLQQTNDLGMDPGKREQFIAKVMGLSTTDIDAAREAIIKAMDNYRSQLAKQQSQLESQITTGANKIQEASKKSTEAQARVATLTTGQQQYNNIKQDLPDVKALQQRIAELEAKIADLLAARDNKSGQISSKLSADAEQQLRGSTIAASQYTKELDKVKAAEQAVGKLQGVIQRWFSIYAVIRMVNQAINSVKNTLKELDKTITEIAIVTNMSQGDLWGQMGTYTNLANKYAASISGVYQVSQLYYQQGLQTNDVMALTEQTLKMARISGLDYAEATDYMTNAVRSFKMEMEDAQVVVDVYSAIAAKSATNVKELAIAMSKTASSAESVGASFQNTTAMMAVMIESTREAAQNIGSAMKSIISRYGEMKVNPAAIKDSEGEALSLNKVDTALQSVGISLHNAQGEFRAFDEVIEELAKSWDTIDINTQRYIATVMAGNRQQSRFLALVSNYDRYKELSEEAANAENASQLQFLKTLDSIEAKSQQLQTNLQSLYTSSGLENLYKGILDIGNAIIKNFQKMPTIANQPILAISKLATTFFSLAQVVKNVFNIIINEMKLSQIQFNHQRDAEIQAAIDAETRELEIAREKEEEKIRVAREGAEAREAITRGEATGEAAATGQLRAVNNKAMALNMSALTLSLISSQLKSSKDEGTQKLGAAASIGSSALSGAAMGSMIGKVGGVPGIAIGAIAGGALGALQNWKILFQDIETKISNAKDAAQNASNAALMRQSETKSLQAQINKIKELERTRYDSVEAEQEYLQANEALAAQYPELISGYADTGEAIIDLNAANIQLQLSLRQTAQAARDAALANFKLVLAEEEREQGEITSVEQASKVKRTSFSFVDEYGQTYSNKSLEESRILQRLGLTDEVKAQARDSLGQGKDLYSLIRNGSLGSMYLKFINADSIEDWIKDTEAPHKLKSDVVETFNEFDLAIYNYMLQQIDSYTSLPSRELASKNRIKASARSGIMSGINNYLSLLEAIEENDPLAEIANSTNIITQAVLAASHLDEIDTEKELQLALAQVDGKVDEYRNALIEWVNARPDQVEKYTKIMSLQGKISNAALQARLQELEDFPSKLVMALTAALPNTGFDFAQSLEKIEKVELKNVLKDLDEEILSDAELQSIISYGQIIETSIEDGKMTLYQGVETLKAYATVWTEVGKIADDDQRESIETLLRTWDGSREGLQTILTTLKDSGLENSASYQAISKLISLLAQNLNTVFETASSAVGTSIKELDDAIKDLSKGVSIDKAVEYATKLGVDLSKFELDLSTGLWKFDDFNQIQQAYISNMQSQIDLAEEQFEKYFNNANIQTLGLQIQRGNLKNLDDDRLDELYNKIFNDVGLTKEQVKTILIQYQTYVTETGEAAVGFTTWLTDHYGTILTTLQNAKTNAIARSQLSLGNVSGFINTLIGGYQEITPQIQQAIAESLIKDGGFDRSNIEAILAAKGVSAEVQEEILALLGLYSDLITNSFKDINSNILESAIKTINGNSVEFDLNKETEQLLGALKRLAPDSVSLSEDRKHVAVDFSQIEDLPGFFREFVNLISLMVPDESTRSKLLGELDTAINGQKSPADIIKEGISNYKDLGSELALKVSQKLGFNDIEAAITAGVIDFKDGKYSLVEEFDSFQERLERLFEEEIITEEDYNDILIQIENLSPARTKFKAFEDVLKNWENLTPAMISALALATGQTYQEFINEFVDIDTSTGKMSLKKEKDKILQLQQNAELEANASASEIVVGVFDSWRELFKTSESTVYSKAAESIKSKKGIEVTVGSNNRKIIEQLTGKTNLTEGAVAKIDLSAIKGGTEEWYQLMGILLADGISEEERVLYDALNDINPTDSVKKGVFKEVVDSWYDITPELYDKFRDTFGYDDTAMGQLFTTNGRGGYKVVSGRILKSSAKSNLSASGADEIVNDIDNQALDLFRQIGENYTNITEDMIQSIVDMTGRTYQEVIDLLGLTKNDQGNYKAELEGITTLQEDLGLSAKKSAIDIVIEVFNDIAEKLSNTKEGIYSKAVASITGKGAQKVTADENNIKFLQNILGGEEGDYQVGNEYNIDLSKMRIGTDAYNAMVQRFLVDGIDEQEQQILDALQSQIKNRPNDLLNKVIGSWQDIDSTTAALFADAFNLDPDEFAAAFSWDPITEGYVVDLNKLRTIISTSGKLNQQQRNEAIAEIDSTLGEINKSNIFTDIAKNYRSLTEDQLSALATALNIGYDNIKKYFIQNDDGTYRTDLGQLMELRESLELAGNTAAIEILTQVIDDYIEQINKISTIQTSGYTKLSDMQAIVSQIGGTLTSIFEWDNELRAYVLSEVGIQRQAGFAAAQLASATGEEQQVINQLITSQKQVLADNIDAMAYITALQSGDSTTIEREVTKFTNAVKYYDAYCLGLGERINTNAEALLEYLNKGGREAVMAGAYIASLQGKELSGEDIETLYRAQVTPFINATEQLTLSVGSVIDETTAGILQQAGYGVQSLGGGKAVITSAGNLVQAQSLLYLKLKETNEASLAELNNLFAQYQGSRFGRGNIEKLSNAGGMSYDTLAQIATDAGLLLEDLLYDSVLGGMFKDIGGKIQVTNFDFFAKQILGIYDTTSQAYIDAFRNYNDTIIAQINARGSNVKNEISAITQGKKGDLINISQIFSGINFDGQTLGRLRDAGAVISDGILELGTNNVTQVLQILNEQIKANQTSLKLSDTDLERIDQAITEYVNNYINNITNNIKNNSSGYTDVAQMQTIADSLNTTVSEIFRWDRNLQAYVLSSDAIGAMAKQAADAIANLPENQRAQARQILESNAAAILQQVSVADLAAARDTDEWMTSAITFLHAVDNYNHFLVGLGKKDGLLSGGKLLAAIREGGQSAVAAAQAIAKATGQQVSGSDIEAIYRSEVNSINNALDQIGTSVGGIIDKATYELLTAAGGMDSANFEQIGNSGKFVVKSAIDVVDAYNRIYGALASSGEATLQELNAVEARILAEGTNKSASTIEALGDAADMSFEALGAIAESIGMELFELTDYLEEADAIDYLGGNHVRITNFKALAKKAGFDDTSSEQFMQAYSAFNDAIIESETKWLDSAIDEIKNIGEATSGSKVNVTYLTSQLSNRTIDALNETLVQYGGTVKDGILTLGDNANIAKIMAVFKDAISSVEGITEREIAGLQDVIEDFVHSITEGIKKGLEGSLTNVEKIDLKDSLAARYGVALSDQDFTKSAEGWKLTEDAALRVYTRMQQIDGLQSGLVLTELNESLAESNEQYRTMGGIMNRIVELEKLIDNDNISTKRRQEYERELSVAREIAAVRATTDSSESFAFMDNKLPGAMENPLTYAENWGKAIHILQNGSGDKKGFIDARDWYNIVNEMNNIAGVTGQSITLFGHTLNGSLDAASTLIQEGFNNLKSIDGGKMQVDLSATLGGIGNAFEQGAIDAQGSITNGIHAMAQSQIDMLDGLISVLETVVAMQEAFAGMDEITEDGQLDFGELFENAFVIKDGSKQIIEDRFRATDEFKTAAQRMIDKFSSLDDLKNPLKQITINGKKLGDLLSAAANGVSFTGDQAKVLSSAMNALYKASLSGNYDLDNIYASVKQELQAAGLTDMDLTIDIGTTTIYLTGDTVYSIDWGSDDTKEKIRRAYNIKGKKISKETMAAAKKAAEDFKKNPLSLSGDNLEFALSTTPEVTINYNDDDEPTYVVEGFYRGSDPEEAAKAVLLKRAGVTGNLTYTGTGKDAKITGGTIHGEQGMDVVIDVTGDKPTYSYTVDGTTYVGDSLDGVLDAYLNATDSDYSDSTSETYKAEKRRQISVQQGWTVTPNFTKGKTFTTPNINQATDFAQWLQENAGKENAGELLQQYFANNNIDIEVGSKIKGPLTPEQIKEIASMFGIDYKLEGKTLDLTINTDGIDDRWKDILETGEKKVVIRFVREGEEPPDDGSGDGETTGDEGEDDTDHPAPGELRAEKQAPKVPKKEGSPVVDVVDELNSFNDITTDGLQSVVTALTQVYDKAVQLQNFDWADLKNKLNIFGPKGEGEGEDGETTQPGFVDVTINPIAEQGLLDLIYGETLERNLIVNVQKKGDNLNPTKTENNDNKNQKDNKESNDNNGAALGEANTGGLQAAVDAVNSIATDKGAAIQNTTDALNALPDQSSLIKRLSGSIDKIQDRSGRIDNLVQSINNLPSNKEIALEISMKIKATADVKFNKEGSTPSDTTGVAKGNLEISNEQASVESLTPAKRTIKITNKKKSKAKGTSALAGGTNKTLMGELGPELVVTDNMYHVVGESGAEFVDLPSDAIVFNHLLTKKLLKNGHGGRGKPITNERNAVAFAKGSGPAMASAAQALAALKQLRAMWASMLNASAKDLGSQAGRGGGGGGKEDNDKYKQPTNVTAEIQRWYNWLRQIDRIEQDITYQEALQKKYESDRIANGLKIYETQKAQYDLLGEEIKRNQKLAELQKSWYDNKRAELAASSYGKIFTYDENGLQQYVGTGKPGSGLGLDILENLTRRNVKGEYTGHAVSAKEQLKYLASVGFKLNDLIYNDDGTKVAQKVTQGLAIQRIQDDESSDDEIFTQMMENFWDNVDGWRDELDSLYDSYREQLTNIEENQTKQYEIIQKFVDNELDIENKLLEAIEAREQAVIDKLTEQKEALQKSTDRFIKGLNDQLDKEKQMQQDNKKDEELTKLQRQLAILQRSGGSASQIKSLQDQIASKQQDAYYDGRQEEIDAIKDATDKQLEKLDKQIELLTKTLEYQKENGLFWNEVRKLMAGPEDVATAFYDKYVTSESGKSALQQSEDIRSFKESFQKWIGWREDKDKQAEKQAEMEDIANYETYAESNNKYLKGLTEDERSSAITRAETAAEEAKNQYLEDHKDEEGAEEGAKAAAAKAYNESLRTSFVNSEQNKEGREEFEKGYNTLLKNRYAMYGDTDITQQDAFKKNEPAFKQAVEAKYLENLRDGMERKPALEGALNYGEEELKRIGEEDAKAATAQAELSSKAVLYNVNETKGIAKKTKTTIAKGTLEYFTMAALAKVGKGKKAKKKKFLYAPPFGNRPGGWILASSVVGGTELYDKLMNAQNITGATEQIDTLSNPLGTEAGENEYYDAAITRKIELSNLNKKALKFSATKLQNKANGELISPQKIGNTIQISDVQGLKFNKKGKISKLSKVNVSYLNGAELQRSEWIKANKTIIKKLNAMFPNNDFKNYLKYLNKYKEGGLVDYTGLARVDGTPGRPEAFLNAEQTAFLKNDLLGHSSNSLMSIVSSLQDSINGTAVGNSNISNNNNNDNVVIENVDVTFEAGTISSDYDARRAGELFKEELVKIARKAGDRSVTRR